jgi:hypothetical protein
MKNFILYLIILPSLYINIFTDTLYSQNNLEKYLRGEVRKSHDFDYEYFNPGPPFLNFVIDNPYTNSIYPNRNISNNSFPQNEPTVCISRKNPDIVVAAWRDFRTGINPPLRRIGYSRSTDGGITWSPGALVPSHDTLHPLASDPALCTDTAGNFYLATITLNLQYDGIVVVYKSTDNGVTFNTGINAAPHADTINQLDDKEYIVCDLAPGSPYRNSLYIAWSGYNGPAFVKSTNGGLTWSERNLFNYDAGAFFDLATGPNGEVYIIGQSRPMNQPYGMYVTKSTDGGETFGGVVMVDSTPLHSGPIAPHRFPSIAVDVSGGIRNGYVYAVYSRTYNYATVNSDEDIYLSYSTNSGQSWSMPPIRVNDDPAATGKLQMWPWISCDDSGNIHIIYYDSRSTPNNFSSEAWIAVSTDGGQSFENSVLSTMQFSRDYLDPGIRFGDYINIDSYGGKIIPVWTDQRQPDANMEIYTALMGDTVIGINIAGTEIPSQFRLHQNYPNPFNPVTTVKFEIPKKTHVKLIVYDIMGREVEVLADGIMNPSAYSVKWNASRFSSGIYFCRLITEGYTETRKMMLIK